MTKLIPTLIQKYNIFDVLYNDVNQIVIISAFTKESKLFNIKMNGEQFECIHSEHTCIFTLSQSTYIETINITIEDNIYNNIKVNRYPIFEDKIIMSTMVYNEDNYIVQWIEYYLILGISHFIIYDNCNTLDWDSWKSKECDSDLLKVLDKYIKNNIVTLIEWPYSKRINKGINLGCGQQGQQNHSIYTFRKCKYIGLFDIDEYVNIKSESEINLDLYLTKILKNNNINIEHYSAINICSKYFYNPQKLPTDGYNFFKIYECSKMVLNQAKKSFVIPKNDIVYSIHHVVKGLKMYHIPTNQLYFNHYYYLNKKNRGLNNSNLLDNSIERIVSLIVHD
jgi:hypothetical protein